MGRADALRWGRWAVRENDEARAGVKRATGCAPSVISSRWLVTTAAGWCPRLASRHRGPMPRDRMRGGLDRAGPRPPRPLLSVQGHAREQPRCATGSEWHDGCWGRPWAPARACSRRSIGPGVVWHPWQRRRGAGQHPSHWVARWQRASRRSQAGGQLSGSWTGSARRMPPLPGRPAPSRQPAAARSVPPTRPARPRWLCVPRCCACR